MRSTASMAAWILAVAGLDQASGLWARRTLSDKSIHLIGTHVMLRLLYNRGAMLGLGSHYPEIITALGIFGTVVLGIWTFRTRRWSWPMATMTGGALGNVLSRLLFHKVTDFVQVNGYPGIFNLSDVALRLGALWLIVAMAVHERGNGRKQQATAGDPPSAAGRR